jgi:hypothetical protein
MILTQWCMVAGGVLSLTMAVFHMRFYVLFGWKTEFDILKAGSRKILYSIHVALILLFAGFAIVSIADSAELAHCRGASSHLVLMYSAFWLWRTIWQVTYLNPHGRPVAKPMLIRHYVLLVVFAALFCLYAAPCAIALFSA